MKALTLALAGLLIVLTVWGAAAPRSEAPDPQLAQLSYVRRAEELRLEQERARFELEAARTRTAAFTRFVEGVLTAGVIAVSVMLLAATYFAMRHLAIRAGLIWPDANGLFPVREIFRRGERLIVQLNALPRAMLRVGPTAADAPTLADTDSDNRAVRRAQELQIVARPSSGARATAAARVALEEPDEAPLPVITGSVLSAEEVQHFQRLLEDKSIVR